MYPATYSISIFYILYLIIRHICIHTCKLTNIYQNHNVNVNSLISAHNSGTPLVWDLNHKKRMRINSNNRKYYKKYLFFQIHYKILLKIQARKNIEGPQLLLVCLHLILRILYVYDEWYHIYIEWIYSFLIFRQKFFCAFKAVAKFLLKGFQMGTEILLLIHNECSILFDISSFFLSYLV